MGRTFIRDASADARDTGRRVILPVMRGVIGIWFPRTTAAHAVYNWKDGGDASTVAGSPSYSTGYVTSSSQSNYLQTTFEETESLTYYAAVKTGAAFSSSSTQPQFIGTWKSQSSGIAGASLQVSGTPSSAPAATVHMYAARDVAGVPTQSGASITVTDMSVWTLFAGAVESGTGANNRRVYDLTNGNSAAATAATARTVATSLNIRLGNLSSLQYGTFDCAAWVVANVAHTQAEIEQNALAIRRHLAARYSITV